VPALQVLEQLQWINWCGDGRDVLVEAVAQYDAGESRSIRIYQDFSTGNLLTTLDPSAGDPAIDEALLLCGEANSRSAARPAQAVTLR